MADQPVGFTGEVSRDPPTATPETMTDLPVTNPTEPESHARRPDRRRHPVLTTRRRRSRRSSRRSARRLPGAEIVVFDNNSTDGTGAIARGLGVRVVDVPEQGKGHAVRAAFATLCRAST